MLNPYQNVFCGVKIIASYLTEFEDYNKALMAYNMGEYGAEKAWENGVESTDYSKSVIALMEHYEEVLTSVKNADDE
jgi:soluble lytic murein transglycosylase-like protein